MAEWTKQEIEKLLAEMTKKAMTDPEFRREVLADANAALEKLAGRPLPEGINLKCIEKDPNYQSTFVLPDLVDEEKLDDSDLASVAGGISVLGLVSVCAFAVGAGPELFACEAKACAAAVDVGFEDCAMKLCGLQACFEDSPSETTTTACGLQSN